MPALPRLVLYDRSLLTRPITVRSLSRWQFRVMQGTSPQSDCVYFWATHKNQTWFEGDDSAKEGLCISNLSASLVPLHTPEWADCVVIGGDPHCFDRLFQEGKPQEFPPNA